jgi:hypothetical protein
VEDGSEVQIQARGMQSLAMQNSGQESRILRRIEGQSAHSECMDHGHRRMGELGDRRKKH